MVPVKRFAFSLAVLGVMAIAVAATSRPAATHGDDVHPGPPAEMSVDEMRELHGGHDHEHDFEAIEEMTPEQMRRVMEVMHDIGIVVPAMDAHHGREIFVERGCIACHQVNGIGGSIGPSLNAADMPVPMNAFEFAARMWRGAGAMIALQEELFGEQIVLTGQELADLIAFAHDEAEQAKLTEDEIPERFRALIEE